MLPSPPLRRLVVAAPVRAAVRRIARWWTPHSLLSRLTRHALLEVHSTRLLARHSWVPPRIRRRFGRTGIARVASLLIVPGHEGRAGDVATSQTSGPVFIDRRVRFGDVEGAIPAGRSIIYAGDDPTFPRQVDARYPSESMEANVALVARLRARGAAGIHVENLDLPVAGVTPMPTGVLPTMAMGSVRLVRTREPRRSRVTRRLKALSASRLRDGAQWETRRTVAALAQGEWRAFCDHLDAEVTMKAYRTLLSTYAFVLCPEGGGLDSSPKAWEALLVGCIPIIRRNASSEGHAHLPVLFVEAWTADALSEDALHGAYRDLRDRLEDRPALLEQLSLQHYIHSVQTSGASSNPGR